MMRPTVVFSDEFAAVIKYHCTKQGLTAAAYIRSAVYDDLAGKYPELVKDIKKETVIK